jgi:signal transduction histidine kinase
LLKLINEILDLAVIESGQVSLSKESISLGRVMSECQSMMEPQAQQRGIRMTFPRFETAVHVQADLTRLKQIIINLLSNAIKYNREKGTVAVECRAGGPAKVRISVRDTGAGLSADQLTQLFQPFNRLGQEAGGVAGTGIGLVVTKQLAEMMDGRLGVESEVGKGASFGANCRWRPPRKSSSRRDSSKSKAGRPWLPARPGAPSFMWRTIRPTWSWCNN